MDELSEEQIMDRLLTLENDGAAEQRAELTGERYMSLIQDPDSGRAYVLRHGVDETEGVEVPEGAEFWEYRDLDEAQRTYGQMLAEARQAGDLVEEDSEEDLGDSETGGAELRDRYSADDDDPLIPRAEEED
jgi:hypothetical protein